MSIAQAKREFAIRYYRWSMAGIVEEFAAGFPWIGRVGDTYSLRLQVVLERLGPVEGLKLLNARARRANDIAIKILGEDLTPEELSLLKAARRMLAQSISPRESEFWQRRRAGDPMTRGIPRKRLMATVDSAVAPLFFGGKPYHRTDEDISYRAKIGAWQVDAAFDFGGYARQMEVVFQLVWPGEPLWLASPLSPLPCLGAGWACWQHHYRNEIDEMANTAADLCRYVLNFVPRLLEGLDVKPEEPPPEAEIAPVDINRNLPLFDHREEGGGDHR